MFSFGLTKLPVFGKARARTFIIVSVFSIALSTDVSGLAGLLLSETHCVLHHDDRNPYKEHTLMQVLMARTYTCCLWANPDAGRVCRRCRPTGVTSQNCLHCGRRPDSQLCMVSIAPNVRASRGKLTKITALKQLAVKYNLELRCNRERMEIFPYGYYLFPSFSEEGGQ